MVSIVQNGCGKSAGPPGMESTRKRKSSDNHASRNLQLLILNLARILRDVQITERVSYFNLCLYDAYRTARIIAQSFINLIIGM